MSRALSLAASRFAPRCAADVRCLRGAHAVLSCALAVRPPFRLFTASLHTATHAHTRASHPHSALSAASALHSAHPPLLLSHTPSAAAPCSVVTLVSVVNTCIAKGWKDKSVSCTIRNARSKRHWKLDDLCRPNCGMKHERSRKELNSMMQRRKVRNGSNTGAPYDGNA